MIMLHNAERPHAPRNGPAAYSPPSVSKLQERFEQRASEKRFVRHLTPRAICLVQLLSVNSNAFLIFLEHIRRELRKGIVHRWRVQCSAVQATVADRHLGEVCLDTLTQAALAHNVGRVVIIMQVRAHIANDLFEN